MGLNEFHSANPNRKPHLIDEDVLVIKLYAGECVGHGIFVKVK